ncbi:MAG: response regulator [Deltaproteobacteria bacterium]|jgi:DNA-binding response OmpR family regulator|nr:response regulator [Deltaproteobacteria bacterium]
MNVKVLIIVEDEALKATFSGYLPEKFVLEDAGVGFDKGPNAIADFILTSNSDLVIMDYSSEDAFSVKVLQEVLDKNDKIGFVFVDSLGQADRENIMMAINEGAQAFIPRDISQVAFKNYLNRVVSGPFRRRNLEINEEKNLHNLNECLSLSRTRLNSAQKLIAYLLSTPLSMQPRKVLVLSDSSYQRELLRKHLEDNNFVVSTCSKIPDAVELTLSEKPRILVSDYELEDGKTGLDFCREIKYVHKFNPCYFVVCTASYDKMDKIMTPGNGVDDCILKPASNTSLNEFLARVALGLIL